MTYDKETRAELMTDEQIEDLRNEEIREAVNEIDDGAMDVWIEYNKEELLAEFIEMFNEEWVYHCKESWRRANE